MDDARVRGVPSGFVFGVFIVLDLSDFPHKTKKTLVFRFLSLHLRKVRACVPSFHSWSGPGTSRLNLRAWVAEPVGPFVCFTLCFPIPSKFRPNSSPDFPFLLPSSRGIPMPDDSVRPLIYARSFSPAPISEVDNGNHTKMANNMDLAGGSVRRKGKVSWVLALSYVFDWAVLIAFAAIGYVLGEITPNQRPFSLDNRDIA